MRSLSFLILPLFLFLFLACNNTGKTPDSPTNPVAKTEPAAVQEQNTEPKENIAVAQKTATEIAEVKEGEGQTEKAIAQEVKTKATKAEIAPTSKAQPTKKETQAAVKATNLPKEPLAKPKASTVVSTPASTPTPTPVAEKPKEAAPPKEKVEKVPAPKAFSHTDWDELLRKHVSSTGKVNYKGIKGEQSKFEGYLKDLAANPVKNDWPRAKKMAYWINAYNAYTIKLIIDNYPVSSITKLNGGKPWDRKWIKLGTDTYSLNDIENNILRPQFKDARIHFAVNCAAKSCPPVLNRAWTAANLNSNFEKQSKAFINGSLNEISAKKIKLSKIFDWYGEDFGDLIAFLNEYSSTPINKNAKIEFVEYDWALNE